MPVRRFELIQAPLDDPIVANGGRPGARFAPEAITSAMTEFAFAPEGPIVQRHALALSNQRAGIRRDHAIIEQAVREVVERDATPIVLGGDNSISYATVRGAKRPGDGGIGVLYLDAHFDMRPVLKGVITSGCAFWRILQEHVAKPDHLVPIGIEPPRSPEDARRKDFEALEAYARTAGVPFVPLADVKSRGIDEVVGEALKRMPERFVLSVDMDCIGEDEAPGVSGRGPDRMKVADVLRAVELAGPQASAFELVEVSPPLDPTGGTTKHAAEIVETYLRVASRREG